MKDDVGHPGQQMFTPVSLDDYVQEHLAANPGVDRSDLVARLHRALAAARAGTRCTCGGPIWVIGSAAAGLSCFTCITGEASPHDDFEIAEALDAQAARQGGSGMVGADALWGASVVVVFALAAPPVVRIGALIEDRPRAPWIVGLLPEPTGR